MQLIGALVGGQRLVGESDPVRRVGEQVELRGGQAVAALERVVRLLPLPSAVRLERTVAILHVAIVAVGDAAATGELERASWQQQQCGVWSRSARARRSRCATIVVPDPGPGEARVQVQACGVCHTDLHYREGAINDDFPFLLGHEAAGIVESVGPDVTERRAGRLRDPELARGVRQLPGVPARPTLVLLRHPQRRPRR